MLRKKILLLSATLFAFTAVQAQLPYTITTSKQAYIPLTSGTEFLPGHIWNDNDNFIALTGFGYKLDTIHCNAFISEGATSIENDTTGIRSSGIIFYEGVLEDRGMLTSATALSPVSYAVTGSPGSRIFKMQVSNAGFDLERKGFGTMNDSVNIQIWIYEGSNILELRYGPSKISHASNYFDFGNGPMVCYALDLDTNATGNIFVLNDDPNNPAIDSIHMTNGNPDNTLNPLRNWPGDSTVYRFTPKTTTVRNTDKMIAKIYPTLCTDHISVELPANEVSNYNIITISGMETNIKGETENGKTNINVSNLPAGIYLLQIRNNSGSYVQKFSKI